MQSFSERVNAVALEAVPEPEIDLDAAVAQWELANTLQLDPYALISGVQRVERLIQRDHH